MRLGSYLRLPINWVFLSRAGRAASRHTSPTGLSWLARRQPTLKPAIVENIAGRIVAGRLTLFDVYNLSGRLFERGLEAAKTMIKALDEPEAVAKAVKTLVGFAMAQNDLKEKIRPFLVENPSLHFFTVYFAASFLHSRKSHFEETPHQKANIMNYYERRHAHELLRGIEIASDNQLLNNLIEAALLGAPEAVGLLSAPAPD